MIDYPTKQILSRTNTHSWYDYDYLDKYICNTIQTKISGWYYIVLILVWIVLHIYLSWSGWYYIYILILVWMVLHIYTYLGLDGIT
jgi:predicted nucleic acid-binding Zn ribbon protein